MNEFNDRFRSGALRVWLRTEEPAAGRYAYAWNRPVPSPEQPDAAIILSGTLPAPMAGQPAMSLDGAVTEAKRILEEVMGKNYPSFLKD